jgi:hypothetical protein
MRHVVLVILALAAIALIPASAIAKSCSSGYTHAIIGGEQKCLHAGEYCSHYEASQYRRYHFVCEDVRGTYRLERT